MAQAQVATPVPDVGKLRPVLDYMPCETCLDMYTPEQDYYCAICPRLVRDIVVKRTALGSDEAVQVIAPEDFSMAKDLRDRIQQQELELQEAREKLAAVARRETDLQDQLTKLNADLTQVRKEKEEAQLVPFEFVGTRDSQAEDALMEFGEDSESDHAPTALAWEPAPEESGAASDDWQAEAPAPEHATTKWEEVPEADKDAAPEPPQFERAETPVAGAPQRPMPTTDDAIARIEAEIAKIEQELQQVADQEKQLAGAKGSKRRKK